MGGCASRNAAAGATYKVQPKPDTPKNPDTPASPVAPAAAAVSRETAAETALSAIQENQMVRYDPETALAVQTEEEETKKSNRFVESPSSRRGRKGGPRREAPQPSVTRGQGKFDSVVQEGKTVLKRMGLLSDENWRKMRRQWVQTARKVTSHVDFGNLLMRCLETEDYEVLQRAVQMYEKQRIHVARPLIHLAIKGIKMQREETAFRSILEKVQALDPSDVDGAFELKTELDKTLGASSCRVAYANFDYKSLSSIASQSSASAAAATRPKAKARSHQPSSGSYRKAEAAGGLPPASASSGRAKVAASPPTRGHGLQQQEALRQKHKFRSQDIARAVSEAGGGSVQGDTPRSGRSVATVGWRGGMFPANVDTQGMHDPDGPLSFSMTIPRKYSHSNHSSGRNRASVNVYQRFDDNASVASGASYRSNRSQHRPPRDPRIPPVNMQEAQLRAAVSEAVSGANSRSPIPGAAKVSGRPPLPPGVGHRNKAGDHTPTRGGGGSGRGSPVVGRGTPGRHESFELPHAGQGQRSSSSGNVTPVRHDRPPVFGHSDNSAMMTPD